MVRALRAHGHDVTYVAETIAGATDEQVLRAAANEGRILITQDQDFGALVVRDSKPHAGIVLVRIPDNRRDEKARRIVELAELAEDRLTDSLTTLTLTAIRIRSAPESGEPEPPPSDQDGINE
jgi:predicted nuclease of predicted toxin-antitoxin system